LGIISLLRGEKIMTGRSAILYLHNKVHISGGERSLLNLWENLGRDEWAPHLMLPGEGPFSQAAAELDVTVAFLSVPKLQASNLPRLATCARDLLRYCRKLGIRIIHSYTPRNNVLAALVGRTAGIPVIWHERNIPWGGEKDVSRRFHLLPQRILCNSGAVAARVRMNGRVPPKVRVIHNGVNLTRFRPGSADPEIITKFERKGRQVVGLVSNLSRRKMAEQFLETCPHILKRRPQTTFIIVGGEFSEEDAGRKRELEERVRRLGLEDHVIFTGFVSAVEEWIRTFDVGCAVTENEACSRAILEMMACGKPIVAFKTGGNPELIDDGTTGILVPFGDTPGMASTVTALLGEREKREEMGRAARRQAEAFFDVKGNAEKTARLYREFLEVSHG
jgi:glycosyltransferase involved in cell wall biosynthesis